MTDLNLITECRRASTAANCHTINKAIYYLEYGSKGLREKLEPEVLKAIDTGDWLKVKMLLLSFW